MSVQELLDPTQGAKPETWQALAPDLHVCDRAFWDQDQPVVFNPQHLQLLRAMIKHEGYIQLDPLSWGLDVTAMANAVDRLARMDAPAVFAFHFDEFWAIYMRASQFVAAILGDDYLMLPDFWAWHVDPKQGQSGWAPHRDKNRHALMDDGMPKSLTLWIPLTDATPLNGCMYIVPADRDGSYNTDDESNFKFKLNDIRALPAKAGSLLAWNAAVLHWGARSAPRFDNTPRVSLALEFQRRDQAPFRKPLMEPKEFIDMPTRQALIGRQILQYKHMYKLSDELAECARRMQAGVEAVE